MPKVCGFEVFEVEFDRNGKVYDAKQVETLIDGVAKTGTTDLVVMSHGWNNDMKEARKLYADWLKSAREVIDAGKVDVGARKIAFAGVLWPSKKFTDEELIPAGGAASVGGVSEQKKLVAQIRELSKTFTKKTDAAAFTKLEKLVPKLETDKKARAEFVATLRKVLTDGGDDASERTDSFFDLDSEDVFARLKPAKAGKKKAASSDEGGAAGFIGDFFRGAFESARGALNYSTYYEMKARAGLVGAYGLNTVLAKLAKKHPGLRIHLVGHSFGGRVVAAAADGPDHASDVKIASLSLLQAAFSQHGFADKWKTRGFFRNVIEKKRISGPVIITHTRNDKAVGLAYALASRLSGVDAAAIGDRESPFGGLGGNGAVKTSEAGDFKMTAVGGKYAFQAGRIHNLESTKYVDDHGDVAGPEVAYATLCAIATT